MYRELFVVPGTHITLYKLSVLVLLACFAALYLTA